MHHTTLSFFIFILYCSSKIKAQQGYSGNEVLDCDHQSNSPPSPSYLYTCNNPTAISCQAFLIFNSQPDYNTVSTISQLFNSSPGELARINNISNFYYIFPTNKEVIIPINCSCLGKYYQANTTYVISDMDTYYNLSTERYQGLSSCSALLGENPYKAENLYGGLNLCVPLRCACPTSNQIKDGTKFLLTYSLNEADGLPDLSKRFNVSVNKTAYANGFSEQDPLVFPLTTVLIPLPTEPLSSQTIIYRPITYDPSPPSIVNLVKRRSKTRYQYLGISAAVVSIVVVTLLVIVFIWLRRKNVKRIKGKDCKLSDDIHNAVCSIDHALKVFEFEELKVATKDFRLECKIQGLVYKGNIGKNVFAIKKMSKDISKEANILHKLNHFNLISLCGIGIGEEYSCLVYEYMVNGSLNDWLQNPIRSKSWNWTQRVQIALDIANGLNYLHNFTYPPYVHMDIKTSNVLLNEKFRAKISNFSIARSTDRMSTKNVEGTLGYLSPEYLDSGIITPKLDVYAFGVVMSELITGRNIINERNKRKEWLFESIACIVEGNNAEQELVDFMEATMRSVNPVCLVMEVAKLCVACLIKNMERRPTMNEVVKVLLRIQRDSQMWALAYQ